MGMSITTKRGDEGKTDLLFGGRVGKSHPRLNAVGEVDELNAALGLVRVHVRNTTVGEMVARAQQDLVALMGLLSAGPEHAERYARQGFKGSDVIFADAAPLLDRVVGGLDTARAQESIARAITVADARKWELIALGAGLVLVLAALLALVPLPRNATADVAGEAEARRETHGGLGLSPSPDSMEHRAVAPAGLSGGQRASVAATASAEDGTPAAAVLPGRPDLAAIADVCSWLARVQFSNELPGLLERTAKAPGCHWRYRSWMPDAASGMLRPALSHGYTPAALARMGGIQPAADNATAAAYRTRTVVAVPPDALAGGAVVAPLHTAEGCSGVLAVELAEGVTPTPQIRAGASIVAAQLATLLTPTPASGQTRLRRPRVRPLAAEPAHAWDNGVAVSTDEVLDQEAVAELRRAAEHLGRPTLVGDLVASVSAQCSAAPRRDSRRRRRGDASSLERAAHTLKSNCAVFGARSMSGVLRPAGRREPAAPTSARPARCLPSSKGSSRACSTQWPR